MDAIKQRHNIIREDMTAKSITLQGVWYRLQDPGMVIGVVTRVEPDGFVVVAVPYGPFPNFYTFTTTPGRVPKKGDAVRLMDWDTGIVEAAGGDV